MSECGFTIYVNTSILTRQISPVIYNISPKHLEHHAHRQTDTHMTHLASIYATDDDARSRESRSQQTRLVQIVGRAFVHINA